MAKFEDRAKALEFRKSGYSYSQIKSILNVSKSTLSRWLDNYPLPEERIRELRDWSSRRIERCRETKRLKREKRLKEFYDEQNKLILPLNDRELFLCGLFLYWGEGSKRAAGRLIISNTDPSIIKFFIKWLGMLDINKEKIHVHLHLYKDMNINEKIKYWSNILDIPKSQFTKPYIKNTFQYNINHKGSFGQGTCNITVNDARISERILMGIKAISDNFIK